MNRHNPHAMEAPTRSRGRRRALAQAGAAALIALTTLGGGVQGQPSATKLMTIPCSSVVPGNQEKVAPVYGLTECYRVTVCVDQPVASDAITPPPELQQPPDGGGQVPPTAPPQSAGAAAAAAAGAGAAGELPEMGAGEEAAMGPRVPPPAYPVLAEDKEGQDSGYVEPSDVESVSVDQMPGLGPALGPVRTPSFTGKRRLRRRAQADIEEAYYEAATGVPFSDEWDFRHQRFVTPPEEEAQAPAQQTQQQQAATPKMAGAGDGIMEAEQGQAGYVVNPDAAVPAGAAPSGPAEASKQSGDGGALNLIPPPTPPAGAAPAPPAPVPAPAPTGNATQPSGAATTPPPATTTPPATGGLDPKAAPLPSPPPQEPPAPPVDDYVGGTGEITVVRFCSREVVCQECGPVNVVPRCTCSLVLYDPLTDPDYFLK